MNANPGQATAYPAGSARKCGLANF